MDIQYHYFVIRTLAAYSGFSEDEAQSIAYYSQQVDDFTNWLPMYVDKEPPEFFTENGLAKSIEDGTWMVVPHPTGIDVIQSLEEHYRHTTLAAFHFLPSEALEDLKKRDGFTRADYRCVCASDTDHSILMWQIIRNAVKSVQEQRTEKSLMHLGMALHTYADTYAHCGYSGLSGWENKAVIKKAFSQLEHKEEVSDIERLFYKCLPHIGHGNSGHVPDICSYQIDVAMLSDEDDEDYSKHIQRDNLSSFLACSRSILDILCSASGKEAISDREWDGLSEKLTQAMPVKTSQESEKKKGELAKHWNHYFPDISYSYEKNGRFYEKTASSTDKESQLYHPTQAFYDYNEYSYKRALEVIGTKERIQANRQLLENALQNTDNLQGQDGSNMLEEHRKGITDTAASWEPKTELGQAVYAAGFEYCPQKDILCSTMYNEQRMLGYCRAYDEAALAISSVIDCEPIRFIYGGHEWLLELWKGQYGIETGCEIGFYYRQAGKKMTELEKKVTGEWFDCVPDEYRIDMCFSLKRKGKEIFSRDWTCHWWLTGFKWGMFSQPEDLSMDVSLRFPNEKMKKAFLEGTDSSEDLADGNGLKNLGYKNYKEIDECTVQFTYAKPYTKQPVMRVGVGDTMQELNKELTQAYNRIKKQYHIIGNDPNVIEDTLINSAGIQGQRLHEKLVSIYDQKAALKKKIDRQK